MYVRDAVVFLSICYRVCCYVDYIPPSEPLCDELIPPVRVRQRRADNNYFYQLSSWETNSTLRIMILGTKRFRMKGFLIQVRKNNTVYGQFIRKTGAILIDCPPGERNTIYYLQANYTTRMNCHWVPPPSFNHKDPIFIFTTAIKKLSKYWLCVERAVPRFPILPQMDMSLVYEQDKGTSQPLNPGEHYY